MRGMRACPLLFCHVVRGRRMDRLLLYDVSQLGGLSMRFIWAWKGKVWLWLGGGFIQTSRLLQLDLDVIFCEWDCSCYWFADFSGSCIWSYDIILVPHTVLRMEIPNVMSDLILSWLFISPTPTDWVLPQNFDRFKTSHWGIGSCLCSLERCDQKAGQCAVQVQPRADILCDGLNNR